MSGEGNGDVRVCPRCHNAAVQQVKVGRRSQPACRTRTQLTEYQPTETRLVRVVLYSHRSILDRSLVALQYLLVVLPAKRQFPAYAARPDASATATATAIHAAWISATYGTTACQLWSSAPRIPSARVCTTSRVWTSEVDDERGMLKEA